MRASRSEWLGWQVPIFPAQPPRGEQDEEEEEGLPDFEELPAIEEHEPLLLPADEDWLLDDEFLSGDGSLPERKEGVLTLWSLVGIMYFASSGGPEGTEGIVAAAGPGGAVLGIVAAALLWSAPIALMSAELGTAVPENGGALVWARAAFGAGTFAGDGAALMAGWCCFLFTAVDAALYPSMFVSYFIAGTGLQLSPASVLALKLIFTMILILHTCAGVGAVGESAKVMIITLLIPFAIFTVLAFTGVAGWPFEVKTANIQPPKAAATRPQTRDKLSI